MKSKCELMQARDGGMVPVVTRGNEVFRLGSSYNGRYAAQRWVDYRVQGKMENVILFGIGDCQIVLRLLDTIPGYVLVYEPDEAIFKEIRQSVLFSRFRKKEKLYILYGEDQKIPLRDVITDILNDDCAERTAVLAHPGYLARYPQEYDMLQEVCQMVCDAVGFTQGAIQRFMKAMVANQLDNMQYLKEGIPVCRLAKYWDPDIPVIMVSAGPSVLKNIDVLKKSKGKAFVFCVDAVLPTLLRHGIVPDLVGSTDALKNMKCFEEPGSFDIPYFVVSNTRHDLVKQLTNKKIWGYDHLGMQTMYKKHGIETARIPAQFGIAAGIFAMLLELGTKNIILVGQDLAYSEDKKTHGNGIDEGFNEEKAETTEGYYGGTVYTRMDWNKFREWFENMISLLPRGFRVINATEGGAKIHGCEQMTLQQALDEGSELSVQFSDILSDERVKLTEREYQLMMAERNRFEEDLEKIRRKGYHKTFFETDFHAIPVMDLVIGYMRYLRDVPDREERFQIALDYIDEQLKVRRKTEGQGEECR